MNGQAKIDFEEYVLSKSFEIRFRQIVKFKSYDQTPFVDYEDICGLLLNALIIEWFDSVGIYISTPSFNDTGLGYQRGFECEIYDEKNNITYDIYNDNDVFETRQEATEKAIEKAIEIYNNLKTK